jgi:hypothetical protein
MEDLDEELALEAHEQMLGYMTKPLAVEEATEEEAEAARSALYPKPPVVSQLVLLCLDVFHACFPVPSVTHH